MLQYDPRQIPSNIIVIGCGGTGSRLVPLLTQFIRSITREFNPRGWLENVTIHLVDDDTVEHKNLLRQNFIEQDVGKHKAVVLAQRYSRAYGIPIVPTVRRIGPQDSYNIVFGQNLSGAMVIMCVDSSEARRCILNMVARSERVQSPMQAGFIIDAGNENNYGQVSFFNMVAAVGHNNYRDADELLRKTDAPKASPVSYGMEVIPYPIEFYSQLEDAPSQGSCADLDQTLAINAAMATTIVGIVQNFYYVKPFTYNQVSISLDGGGYTTFNTTSNYVSRIAFSEPKGMVIPYSRCDYANLLTQYGRAHKKLMSEMNRAAEEAAKAARVAEERRLAEEALKATPAEEGDGYAGDTKISAKKASKKTVELQVPTRPVEIPQLVKVA